MLLFIHHEVIKEDFFILFLHDEIDVNKSHLLCFKYNEEYRRNKFFFLLKLKYIFVFCTKRYCLFFSWRVFYINCIYILFFLINCNAKKENKYGLYCSSDVAWLRWIYCKCFSNLYFPICLYSKKQDSLVLPWRKNLIIIFTSTNYQYN